MKTLTSAFFFRLLQNADDVRLARITLVLGRERNRGHVVISEYL